MDLRKRIAKYIASPNTSMLESDREELSFSRMSSMMRNPYEHHLKYKKHLRGAKEKSNLMFGKMMHETLAFFYNTGMEATPEDLHDYLVAQMDGYMSMLEYPVVYSNAELLDGIPRKEHEEAKKKLEKDEEYLKERSTHAYNTLKELGKKMLVTYYNDYAEDDILHTETLEIEVPFWIPLVSKSGRISPRYMISGIIDRIYKDTRDGKIYIQDHKNLARRMDETTPGTSNQISVYYLGAVYLGYMVDGAEYNNLYKTKTPTTERLRTTRTNEQLLEFMEDANDIAQCISHDIKFKNYQMGMNMSDFKDFILYGDDSDVIEYVRTPLKERYLNGELE